MPCFIYMLFVLTLESPPIFLVNFYLFQDSAEVLSPLRRLSGIPFHSRDLWFPFSVFPQLFVFLKLSMTCLSAQAVTKLFKDMGKIPKLKKKIQCTAKSLANSRVSESAQPNAHLALLTDQVSHCPHRDDDGHIFTSGSMSTALLLWQVSKYFWNY